MPPGLRAKRRRYHPRRSVSRPRPYVRVSASKTGGERPGPPDERAVIAQGAARIPAIEEALLGQALLGQGLLFNHQRSNHRRHRTSVPRTAYPKSHRRKPVGRLVIVSIATIIYMQIQNREDR